MDRESAALLERASTLRRAGRIDEAIAAYAALLQRQPGLADSWYNLGWLQRQARQYEAALESYARALASGVRDPEEVRLNRAVILSDHLFRPEEALAELEAALELKPDYLAALLNLGNLHEDLGDREAAEQAYRRALDVAPDDALALSRLAGLLDAQSDDASEIIGRIRSALATERDAAEQADLGFALGRLLDSQGQHEPAFQAYEAANRASKRSFGEDFRGYDREAHERMVDRLIAAFPSTVEGSGPTSPAIFVLGMFRSGSTLVEQMLAAHSRIVSGGELDLIPALASSIGGYPESIATAGDRDRDAWRRFYLDGLKPFLREGSGVTDKRPDNFLHIGLIKTLFPDAKIVHTRRNRLDNLLSLYFLHLDPGMAYALDLTDAAHWHGQYERLMAHWNHLYPNDIFEVNYEDVIRDPNATLKPLLAFLGLDWDESVLDFHRRKSRVKTASAWQVRQPLHARSAGRWRNYEKELTAALGPINPG